MPTCRTFEGGVTLGLDETGIWPVPGLWGPPTAAASADSPLQGAITGLPLQHADACACLPMTGFLYRRTWYGTQGAEYRGPEGQNILRASTPVSLVLNSPPAPSNPWFQEKTDYSEPLSVPYLSLCSQFHSYMFRGLFILGPPSKANPSRHPIPIESLHKPIGPNPTETKQKQNAPDRTPIRNSPPVSLLRRSYPPSRADIVVIRRAPATLPQPSDAPSHTLSFVLRAV